MTQKEKGHRLLQVYEKEASLDEFRAQEDAAAIRRLCAEASSLAVSLDRLQAEAQAPLGSSAEPSSSEVSLDDLQAELVEARREAQEAWQAKAAADAESRWAKERIQALLKENAWLRQQWADTVAPASVGLPPPPQRPVCGIPVRFRQ